MTVKKTVRAAEISSTIGSSSQPVQLQWKDFFEPKYI